MKTVLAPGAPWYEIAKFKGKKVVKKKRTKPPRIDDNFKTWLLKEGFVMEEENTGWRKSQIEKLKEQRNKTLEEVAQEFDKMKALGDTASSFAAFVRGMKDE